MAKIKASSMKPPGAKALPMPKGGAHGASKPRLRTRHLAVSPGSAFGAPGAPQAFPDTGGGTPPFDPNSAPGAMPSGGAAPPAMPPGGPAPGM